jgi:opacity protein-like surface antigen
LSASILLLIVLLERHFHDRIFLLGCWTSECIVGFDKCKTESLNEGGSMRHMLIASLLGILISSSQVAEAQEVPLQEISILGTGFFTKNSEGDGVTQRSTNSGGLLLGYRIHLTRWLAADGTYGYSRNTQRNFATSGLFGVQSNVNQIMGSLVANLPATARFEPYVLAGAGTLIFDPTDNEGSSVTGADTQTKAAFVYGGGGNYHMFPHVSLRFEYRGLAYRRPDFGLGFLSSGRFTHTAQPSGGLVFRF